MGDSRRSRWWTLLCAAAVMGMMSALGGTWDAPPGAPPMVTPRGTAPLPPGSTPVPAMTATASPPPPPPAATATPPGAPVGIAPAAPTATLTPLPPPPLEATATAAPAPAGPTVTPPAPVVTSAAAAVTATPPRATPSAQAPATPPAATAATVTPPPPAAGLIAGDAPPAFPAVLPQSVEALVQPGMAAPVTLALADRRVSVAVRGAAVREPVRLTLAAAGYGQGQREAALRQGLLLTNVGFTLDVASAAGSAGDAPEGEITVRYSAAQVSGIEEASLGLYRRAASGAWEALPGCKTETAERRVVCRAPATGDFLLAGTSALPFDATMPTGAPAAGATGSSSDAFPWRLIAIAGGIVAVVLGIGAAVMLQGRRVRS